MLIKQIINMRKDISLATESYIEFLNTYWAVTSMRFEKCVCLAQIDTFGIPVVTMEAEQDFFLHSEYKVTTGFLFHCSLIFEEVLEFGQSWRQTIGGYTLMFLKDWHSLTMSHMRMKTIVRCGIRIFISPLELYYSPFSIVECAQGHFLKMSGNCL